MPSTTSHTRPNPLTKMTTAILVSVVVTAGLLAGPAAAASADAYNRSSAYLRLPSEFWEPTRCVERSIWLARGAYRWRMYHRWWANSSATWETPRYVWLRAGWYRWRDCLDQSNDPPQGLHRGYIQFSQLYERATGGQPAQQSVYTIASFGTGTYTYGSALLRTGP
jgi:hypothetical protein